MRLGKIKLKFFRKLFSRRRRGDSIIDRAPRNNNPGHREIASMPIDPAPSTPELMPIAVPMPMPMPMAIPMALHEPEPEPEPEPEFEPEPESEHELEPEPLVVTVPTPVVIEALQYYEDHSRHPAKRRLKTSSRPEPASPSPSSAGTADEEAEETNEKQEYVQPEPEPEPEECPICHDAVGIRNPEGVLEGWVKLYCGHRFGSNCLKIWLQASLDRGPYTLPSCPICRTVARAAPPSPVPPTVVRCRVS